jgi:hypothetical protein
MHNSGCRREKETIFVCHFFRRSSIAQWQSFCWELLLFYGFNFFSHRGRRDVERRGRYTKNTKYIQNMMKRAKRIKIYEKYKISRPDRRKSFIMIWMILKGSRESSRVDHKNHRNWAWDNLISSSFSS